MVWLYIMPIITAFTHVASETVKSKTQDDHPAAKNVEQLPVGQIDSAIFL